MGYKAVIFDLDGTLLDTLDDLKDGINFVLKKYGYPLQSRDEIKAHVGNGVKRLLELSLEKGLETNGFDDMLSEFKDYYKDNAKNKTAPYDGITELLSALNKKGVKLAVVSNKFDGAVKELCRYYFNGLIPVAIGEQEAKGIRKKPNPDTVFAAAKELNCDIADCVYIGDSEVDIETAKNAKTDCITVTWGFREEEYLKSVGGKVFAHKPMDIIKLI